MRKVVTGLLGVLVAMTTAAPAQALAADRAQGVVQSYPNRPIRLIDLYAPKRMEVTGETFSVSPVRSPGAPPPGGCQPAAPSVKPA